MNGEKANFIGFENIKSRYNILDNYKGILIFLVVFAHFLYEYSINLLPLIENV